MARIAMRAIASVFISSALVMLVSTLRRRRGLMLHLLLLLLRLQSLLLLVVFVPADHADGAAGDEALDAVMMGVVAGDSARGAVLKAAAWLPGFRRRRREKRRAGQTE